MTIAWTGRAARTLAAAVTDRAPAVAVVTADPDGTDIVTAGCSPGDGFEIGSITKTMTGTLLADAAAGGRMSLDDPVGRWLDAGENADITVGELATHTSGLPRLSPSHVAGTADPYAFLTADTARICTPLAMICTGIDAATSRQGHRAGKPVSPWTHHLAGAGGVVATAEDMAAYLHACLTAPQGPLGAAIELAQRPHHRIDQLRSAHFAVGAPGSGDPERSALELGRQRSGIPGLAEGCAGVLETRRPHLHGTGRLSAPATSLWMNRWTTGGQRASAWG